MEIIDSIWLLGSKDRNLVDDVLEVLINWHMSTTFSQILFGKLVENKYQILKEILRTIIA